MHFSSMSSLCQAELEMGAEAMNMREEFPLAAGFGLAPGAKRDSRFASLPT